MQKIFTGVMLFLFLMVPVISVKADEEGIDYINIEVQLKKDGSADITETWSVKGVYSGTEYYIGKTGVDITDLQVWDETGVEYTSVDSWDVNAALEEKAYKYGLHSSGEEVEICWGIGSYGDHIYTIQYHVQNMVEGYTDYDGFYHQLVASGMSSAPDAVSVVISMENQLLSAENAQIWSYGYEGMVEFEDGNIVAYTQEALGGGDSVKVLLRLDKGMVTPARVHEQEFEELKKKAEDNVNVLLIVLLVLGGIGLLCVIFIVVNKLIRTADGFQWRPSDRKTEPRGDIPFGGDIAAVFCGYRYLKKSISLEAVFASFLLRWEQMGYIRITEENEGAKKKEVIIQLEKTEPSLPEEKALLAMLKAAAADNKVKKSKLEKWLEKNHKEFQKWQDILKKEGEDRLLEKAVLVRRNKKLCFTGSGYEKSMHLLGFHKFLKQYSADNQWREEKALWGDYLVFAALLGISKNLAVTLNELDPDGFNTCLGIHGDNFMLMHMILLTNHVSGSVASAVSDGSGGAASGAGGGGFSGSTGGGSR